MEARLPDGLILMPGNPCLYHSDYLRQVVLIRGGQQPVNMIRHDHIAPGLAGTLGIRAGDGSAGLAGRGKMGKPWVPACCGECDQIGSAYL